MKRYYARNVLFHGWGIVEGRFVYVPLWDPAPERMNEGLVSLLVADQLQVASQYVTAKAHAEKLQSIAHTMASNISAQISDDWDGGICPPNWPPIHHHFNDEFGILLKEMPQVVRNAMAGYSVTRLGEITGNEDLVQLGREITAGQKEMQMASSM